MNSAMEKLFYFLDSEAASLQAKGELSYLESLLAVLEEWLDGDLKPAVSAGKEEKRKAIQLAVLKGMKEHVQPNHQMTPDSIGLLLSYFMELFIKKEKFTLLDPAAGTGNLLLTVMNYFDGKAAGTAVEIDELLIRIASASAELTEQPVTFYRQDALSQLFIDPSDAVAADLPVGYYPDEDTASHYDMVTSGELPYAHHLFIEQSLRHTKDGGYLFFIVPQNLFESPESKNLHAFLKNRAHIQAVIQLPEAVVKKADFAKSILILQKTGSLVNPPRDVLLARVPNMSNKIAMSRLFKDVDKWFRESKE